jgi:hypothetical protein
MKGTAVNVTAYMVKKSISQILREELERRGVEVDSTINKLGMLVWVIAGEHLSMREAADRFLVGGFAANV